MVHRVLKYLKAANYEVLFEDAGSLPPWILPTWFLKCLEGVYLMQKVHLILYHPYPPGAGGRWNGQGPAGYPLKNVSG